MHAGTRNVLSKGRRIAILGLFFGYFIVQFNLISVHYSRDIQFYQSQSKLQLQPAHDIVAFDEMEDETATLVRSSIVAEENNKSTSPTIHVRWKDSRRLGIEREQNFRAKHHLRRKRKKEEQPMQHMRKRARLRRPRQNTATHNITIDLTDMIYYQQGKQWDVAPIVIAEYKLVFFTIPKVGCTVFKQLFRRIAQCPDWRTHDYKLGLPHNPGINSLTYLYHYGVDDALHIMTSDEWTRAIFVRDPTSRVISAYLDKAQLKPNEELQTKSATYVTKHCCPRRKACGPIAQRSFHDFLHILHWCSDSHWSSQSLRMQTKFWPYVNFIGHLETAQADAKALLERVGAWEQYGATGWGADGSEPIFESKGTIVHKTNPQDQRHIFCSTESMAAVNALYADDLQNPLFGFHGNGICSEQ